MTSTQSDTTSRPTRRAPNRTHGWEIAPARGIAGPPGGATELARAMSASRYFASMRMLVGMSVPG